MKKQLTHNSDFIRDNVLDTTGYQVATSCPSCGKEAVERTFDECLGGTINQVDSVDCHNCNYHECCQEFCSVCEIEAEILGDEMCHCFEIVQQADLMLDYLVSELATNSYVNATEITSLKLKLISNNKATRLFDDIFVPVGTRTFTYMQRKLLDARFSRNLELKIVQAKAH